jgi:hypothetical protein
VTGVQTCALPIYKGQISSQKNEDGRTSAKKAFWKALVSDNLRFVGELAGTVLNYAVNPITALVGSVSFTLGAVFHTKERQEVSNQKQTLKNAIEHFRTRADVPGYNSLGELQKLSREAKLETKALEKLSNNQSFRDEVAKGDAADVTKLQSFLLKAKAEVVREDQALSSSSEVKKFLQERESLVEQRKEKLLREHFNDFEKVAIEQLGEAGDVQKTIEAMKLIADAQARKEVYSETASKENELVQGAFKKMPEVAEKDYHVLVSKYENQDQKTTMQKVKEVAKEVANGFNVFDHDLLSVREPDRLLHREDLQKFTLHKEHAEVHKEHEEIYHNKTQELKRGTQEEMSEVVKIERKLAPFLQKVYSSESSLVTAPQMMPQAKSEKSSSSMQV